MAYLEALAAVYVLGVFITGYFRWLALGKTFDRASKTPVTRNIACGGGFGGSSLLIPVTPETDESVGEEIDLSLFTHVGVRQLRKDAVKAGHKGAGRWRKARLLRALGYV